MRPLVFICLVVTTLVLAACASTSSTNTSRPTTQSQATEVALKARVGKKYWINPASPPVFLQPNGQTAKPWGDEFTITAFTWLNGMGIYQVKASHYPDTLYTNALSLQETQIFTESRSDRAAKILKAEEQRKAEEKAAKEVAFRQEMERYDEQIKSALAKVKLTPGTVLWTNSKTSNFVGLTRVVIKSHRLDKSFADSIDKVSIEIEFESDAGKTGKFYVGTIADAKKKDLRNLQGDFYRKLPAWGTSRIKDIQAGKVVLGMSEAQVIAAWGYPKTTNETTGAWGTHEQWVYSDRGPYLYLENGRLTSWQN
jgi:hypothetical protein